MPSDFPKNPEAVRSVIVLVHGIRTQAPWVAMLRAEFERAGIVVEPTNYGRLDVLRFLWGSRRAPLDAVWDSVKDVQRLYPNAEISFLAHSFGTYIVSRLLQREFDFKAHRIAFCGSVVHHGFPFKHISERFTAPIVNEVSARDPWPVVGASASWGYGSVGTYGFKVPRVRDRWHRGFGHSQYLTKEFCTKFWIPFFTRGEIVEGDLVDAQPPMWVQLFSVLHIKYLVVAFFTVLCVEMFFGPFLLSTKKNPFEAIGMKPRDVPKVAQGAPDLGPQPNPACNIVFRIDSTVVPPKSYRAWDCP